MWEHLYVEVHMHCTCMRLVWRSGGHLRYHSSSSVCPPCLRKGRGKRKGGKRDRELHERSYAKMVQSEGKKEGQHSCGESLRNRHSLKTVFLLHLSVYFTAVFTTVFLFFRDLQVSSSGW